MAPQFRSPARPAAPHLSGLQPTGAVSPCRPALLAWAACLALGGTAHAADTAAPFAPADQPAPQPVALALAPAAPTEAALAAAAMSTQTVTVTGRAPAPPARIAGFGDVPPARAPFQTLSLGTSLLLDNGVDELSGVSALDAGVSDAYNAPGYWTAFTVRGFVLDNRANYRRDGLLINAETAFSLANKERIEVLKGTSGIQAGTSSPGGLVNLVVKRPLADNRRGALLAWTQDGTLEAAADINQRLNDEGSAVVRLNASAARLDPTLQKSRGERHLLAAAGDLQITPDDQLQAEVEWSRQSQPSAPGFSLLGDTVPSARGIDPDLNLNNQRWAQPVVFQGTTASLKWNRTLNADWRMVAHAMSQSLRTDDRIAFPFGCSNGEKYLGDRYCQDGSFDLYDYRSDNERRDSLAADLSLEGSARTGSVKHDLATGVTFNRYRGRFGPQAYNYVGSGNIHGDYLLPPKPEPEGGNTNRTERSTELHLADALHFDGPLTLWLALRHSRLVRESVGTDGSERVRYEQNFTTPWAALSWQLNEAVMAYASWGQGVETDAAPNRPEYTNAGQPLPALKSRQWELGLKGEHGDAGWSLTAFDIRRPLSSDFCVDEDTEKPVCTRSTDGNARHQGVEATADTRLGDWSLRGSALWLKARREGSIDPADNGRTPTNVPDRALKLQGEYRVPALPGLSLLANLIHEGRRYVLPDNSAQVPSWTRVDLGVRHRTSWSGHAVVMRLGVDNAFDRRAWEESPYQFGHAYLFPLAPRTFRASLQATW